MHIALMGTRGVPARYGGFETCVEEVGTRLAADGHRVTVYCRRSPERPSVAEPAEYRGMRLVWLPAARRKTLETLSHTALSAAHAVRHRPDAVVLFNSANAPLLPLLRARRIPVATHVDGLEWRRAKWAGAGQRYYRRAEALAVRWSDALVADARGIEDYYRERFGVACDYIAYGAPILAEPHTPRLAGLDLERHGYHLVVARFEPENHVDVAVAGYLASSASLPLVVVGAAPYADEYTAKVTALAERNPRVRLLGSVWDQELLDALYANALTYLHGHSVGGTNPSLLRAMGAGAATTAFDVSFNREVLGEYGRYFGSADELAASLEASEADVPATLARGTAQVASLSRYDWDDVADRYARLVHRIAGRPVPPREHHPVPPEVHQDTRRQQQRCEETR